MRDKLWAEIPVGKIFCLATMCRDADQLQRDECFDLYNCLFSLQGQVCLSLCISVEGRSVNIL